MMRYLATLLVAILLQAAAPAPAMAGEAAGSPRPAALVATRPIRAREVIGPDDVERSDRTVPGAISDPSRVIGQEAQVWLQAGRVIMPSDIAAPALVERNQIVTMRFRRGQLEILADGRALERAPLGARVRVMNLDSRATVTGTVVGSGVVEVR